MIAAPILPDFLYSSIPAVSPSKIPIPAVTASPIGPANLAAPASILPAPLTTPPAFDATTPAPLARVLPTALVAVPAKAFSATSLAPISAGSPIIASLRAPSFSKKPPPLSSSFSFPSIVLPRILSSNEVCLCCSSRADVLIIRSSAASSTIDAPPGPGFARVGGSGILSEISLPKFFNARRLSSEDAFAAEINRPLDSLRFFSSALPSSFIPLI